MPRICSREGCGTRLMDRHGHPDYGRYFCSAECKKIDKRDRRRARLAEFSGKKCPYCGRSLTGNHNFQRGVSRHRGPSSGAAELSGVSSEEPQAMRQNVPERQKRSGATIQREAS
jgi:hypothetical protein